MRTFTGPRRASRSIAAIAAAAALVPGLAKAGPGTVTNPVDGLQYPTYYANSPAPGLVSSTTPTIAGNALVARASATDGATNVLVLSPATIPAGSLTTIQIFNQVGPGNTVQAFILRPTVNPGEYTVAWSAVLTTTLAAGQVETFAVGPFAVQAGDKLAHYGQSVPFDQAATAVDAVYYPCAAAPAGTIALGGAAYPTFDPAAYGQLPRTYSIAAVVDVTTTALSGGLRKFVDTLPGLGTPNNLGQQLTVAVPDTTRYPGSDYYEIAVVEYTERMHSDLQKATRLRGYVQKVNGVNGTPHYLGPVIVAQRDRPVRLKVFNELDSSIPFFIPVDATLMGAGEGNLKPDGSPCDPMVTPGACATYSQARTTTHLHGGFTPWISDGTPHQWTTPVNDPTIYKVGDSARDVPDMATDPVNYIPANGTITLYYPNQQSGRLMFYHDHAYGITRLNVYGGVAAGYLLIDPAERALTNGSLASTAGTTAAADLPLVIQDKTFVPNDIATQDARWSLAPGAGQPGDLWFPHVYEANQDPTCAWSFDCMNPLGRWDYGPWIWPPVQLPAMGQQLATDLNVSAVPESFMDVMVVNGTVYPLQKVEPKAYRLRILNASNDRFLNLQLYYAAANVSLDPTRAATFDRVNGQVCDGSPGAPTAGCTEVRMVPRDGGTYTTRWGVQSVVPFDGRPGGVPNPVDAGPKMLQIGTEGGLLPAAVEINNPPIPVTYDTDPKSMTVGNVIDGTMRLGPAERSDVIVDFSQVAPGSRLILYNDAPAAYPAGDQRYDYYTFGPAWTDNGGAPSPMVGFGPNTRTVMQFEVVPLASGTVQPFDFAAVAAAVPAAYAASQEAPIVPEPEYRAAFPALGTKYQFAKIFNTVDFSYSPSGKCTCPATAAAQPAACQALPAFPDCVTLPIHQKAIAEEFDPLYGRMSALLGTEAQVTGNQGQNTFGFYYVDPATEVLPQGETQIWKLTHNGVDTHAIHFHLLNVQVINRVDWAGVVKAPDANELGWKETVRMNPLEDIILAVRAVPPKLPFTVPDSQRLRDVTRPQGVSNTVTGLNFTVPWPYLQPQGTIAEPTGAGTTTFNDRTAFSWEYVWHCHLLGHEENDMMRPLIMTNVSNYNTADTYAPTITVAPAAGGSVGANQAFVLTATDSAAGRPAYLDTGVVSMSWTVTDAAGVVTTGSVAGGAAAIAAPAAGWPLGLLTIQAQATDGAAVPNTGVATFSYTVIVLDNTPPTLVWGAAAPAANVRGWNNTDVAISYTATDTQSPPVTSNQPNPVVITGEGVGLTAPPVTVTDAVGNGATFTWPGSVRIDRTPPTVINTVVTPPSRTRGNGTSGVRFTGSASDALSGLFINPNANEGTYRITNNKSTQVLTGTFNVAANGAYSFSVNVPRANTGTTRRIWTATISVRDNADNVGSTTATYIIDPQLP